MEETSPATAAANQTAPAQASTQGQMPGATSIPPKKQRMYPELIIPYPEHPNRLLAFPLLGYAAKALASLPQAFIIMFLGVFVFILWLITPFVTLFTGKLWNPMYKYSIIYLRFYTKVYLFLYGLTDKYPGFSMDEGGIFALNYPKPEKSSRLLAFPIVGIAIRIILLIPFSLFGAVMGMGAFIALICSWFVVLFTGRYPESLYEFIKDYFRVWNAFYIYLFYLSDTYPSFRISMNHKVVKIILLALGTLLLLLDYGNSFNNALHPPQNQYNNSSPASTSGY